MEQKTLAGFTKGIDRTRARALPKPDTFYLLRNCYIDQGGRVKKRPGFRHVEALDAATKGLFSGGGELHTFYTADTITMPVDVQAHRLIPSDPADTLTGVYYCNLYLGGLYVGAEMNDGSLPHYWMKSRTAWKASTVYLNSDSVAPTVENGFYYVPSTTINPPAWAAGVAHSVGDQVQPTTYNGYYYTVTAVDGDGVTGDTEPTWTASEGALVYEDVLSAASANGVVVPSTTPGGDRYSNLPGYVQ